MARKTLGFTTIQILQAVATGMRYGFDIMDATGLKAGTVYPALGRLESNGLVRARWEDPRVAHRERRPRRRYYTITAQGKQRLLAEAERIRALERSIPRDLEGFAPSES